MTQQATLSFRTVFRSSELSSLELPVVVRDSRLRVVARTLTSQQLQVEPGEYYVSCRLPAGQEFQTHIKVGEGETVGVDLAPSNADSSPTDSLEVQHYLRKSARRSKRSKLRPYAGERPYSSFESAIADNLAPSFAPSDHSLAMSSEHTDFQVAYTSKAILVENTGFSIPVIDALSNDDIEAIRPISAPLVVRWFWGNALKSVNALATGEQLLNPAVPLPLTLPDSVSQATYPVVCQLQVAGRPAVNVLVPMPPNGPAPSLALVASESDPSTYRISIRLSHPTADLLTRYLIRGMFQEANESITSDSMRAEHLLEEKSHDPVAAAVGAYTILKLGDIDQLASWILHLRDRFEWLPDGAAICGEHFARLGSHQEALQSFLLLQSRGLPFFAEGLSYAIDRLRVYAKASKSNPFSDADVAACKNLLDHLKTFATFTDFNRALLNFTGADPASPECNPSILRTSERSCAATEVNLEAFSVPQIQSALMADAVSPYNETQFVFNGINGATGEYLESPKTARQLITLALSDPSFAPPTATENSYTKHLDDLKRRQRLSGLQTFGVRFGVQPARIDSAGWGVVFPATSNAGIREALQPLLQLRKQQAGDLFKEFSFKDGESKDDFLTRNGMGPGPADPTKVPYYLLIVADPETIPYQVQYQLDVQYAVGRIWFETLDEYANYARSVVLAETGKVALPRKAVMFGTQNAGDGATQLSFQQLVLPLASLASKRGAASEWQVETIVGAGATRDSLSQLLNGDKAPALLFTASHGMGFPLGDNRQSAHQGALLCQDWPGPSYGRVDRGHYFAAEDVTDAARLTGLISFHFACYGAGTPKLDDFAHQEMRKPTAIAPRAFVAPLPRRLLGHPAGGALAVVGHVERAWGCSIVWSNAGQQIQAYEDAIDVLMKGLPVGFALESINQRYADLSSSLSADLLSLRNGTKAIDDYSLAFQWTANNDARSHVIIGDPAVRLPVAPPGAPTSPRATITPIKSSQSIAMERPSDPPRFTEPPDTPTITALRETSPVTTKASANTSTAVLNLNIPLQLTLNVAIGRPADADSVTIRTLDAIPATPGAEPFAIQIDPNYAEREGYDPNFLGTGASAIPLPQLSAAQFADAAQVDGNNNGDRELKYHHYSVVLNGKRRLAFFTAVNINGKLAARPSRETDRWFYDPRVLRSMQVGNELYESNPFDRGHLVRRLDPAWGRSDTLIKRANDDTFHFTNCSPQHERFNQGQNLWAGLEDFLLDKASDEERRMTVFTGPVFTSSDPEYRDVLIPKQFWKVAVVSRPTGSLASLGFIVDQSALVSQVVTFDPTSVAKTFQVPVRQIEAATGLRFGRLADLDAATVDSFAVGATAQRELKSFDDIVIPKSSGPEPPGAATTCSAISQDALPSETIDGSPLRYFLIAFDENGSERTDHPAGIISRLVERAVADPAATDVVLFSHGWMGDVRSAREQYSNWIRAMSGNDADYARASQVRPGFKPVLVGIHWPSLPWGDESLNATSFAAPAAFSPPVQALSAPSIAAEVESFTEKMGDSPEARERIRSPLRAVLELVANTPAGQTSLPAELRDAYMKLDASLGLAAQGVAGDPSSDREPFDPDSVFQEFRTGVQGVSSNNPAAFGIFPSKDDLLAPLRTVSYWKMKDRARKIGEGAVNNLLIRLQQAARGRNVRFYLVGHSFGCIVASGAVAGQPGSDPLPQPVDGLILLQGAVSLWSYCADIPYAAGTAGYYHRLVAERHVRGPIVTTSSTYDKAVGTWYPLSSRVTRSVAFDAPGQFPKYGGIGTFGLQGNDLQPHFQKILKADNPYALASQGAVTNIDASDVIRNGGGFSGAHSDICHPEVAHIVWSAMLG